MSQLIPKRIFIRDALSVGHDPALSIVIVRESGRSSTHRTGRWIEVVLREASDYWVARSSRATTGEGLLRSLPSEMRLRGNTSGV